ncbi:F-box domain-containing protein [Mycena venus]|uniref:F-box domain-containing protein n=1 Tax=Mycena venus TaxID=2733690 RepID=A0A8H7D7S4_9AGAR|nr:F-box domain-containing protein [Mycena venus]
MPSFALTDLPTELLLEIISYKPYSFDFLSPVVNQEALEQRRPRRDTLRALSQSCSVLRSVSLPFLWERVDISNSIFRPSIPKGEVAICIFPYIKYVHLSMGSWRKESLQGTETLPLLLEFLCALPSLAGLQINHPSESIIDSLSSAFAEVSLPTVFALSIPEELYTILPAFPNLRTLAFPSFSEPSEALAAAKTHLFHLDALVGLRVYYGNETFTTLASDFPRLRVLSVASPFLPEYEPCLRRLSAFTHLSELGLFHAEGNRSDFLSLEKLVAGGREVLRASQSTDAKMLWVWGNDYEHESGARLVYFERC